MFRIHGWVIAGVVGLASVVLTAGEARADGLSLRVRVGSGHDRGKGHDPTRHHARHDHHPHHARPVVIHPPGPSGYWTTREVRVIVSPGRWETRYCPATTRVSFDHGRLVTIITPAHHERYFVEPVYATRHERVWVSTAVCP